MAVILWSSVVVRLVTIATSGRRPMGSTDDYCISVMSAFISRQAHVCFQANICMPILLFRNMFSYQFIFFILTNSSFFSTIHQKRELSQDLDFSFLFLKRAFQGANSSFFFLYIYWFTRDPPEVFYEEKKGLLCRCFSNIWWKIAGLGGAKIRVTPSFSWSWRSAIGAQLGRLFEWWTAGHNAHMRMS